MTRSKQKQIYFSLPNHQLAENQIFVFGLQERKKKKIKKNLQPNV